MIATTGTEYRMADSHWGKYDDGFHAWLVEACDPDEYDGDSDYGGVARYGRRVDDWTTTGFHSLTRYDTVEEAQEAYNAWADEYNAPEVHLVDDWWTYKKGLPHVEGAWGDQLHGTYSHPDYRGVALRFVGPAISAHYFRDGDVEYEIADSPMVAVHMVGDDSLFWVDREDLTPIEDYCSGCGQIGCEGDFRNV